MVDISVSRSLDGRQVDLADTCPGYAGLRSAPGLALSASAVVPSPDRTVEALSFLVLDVGSELADALAFPPWTGTVLKFAGLCILLIGVMAWLTAIGIPRRAWGRRVALSGVALTIVGFAFDAFVEVLKYVLTG